MTLLVNIKTAVDTAKAENNEQLQPAQLINFKQRYQTLLTDGFEANPPPPVDDNAPKKRGRLKQSRPKNLLERLQKHQSAVLAFYA